MEFRFAAKGIKKVFSAEILTLISDIAFGAFLILAAVSVTAAVNENETGLAVAGTFMLVSGIAAVVLMVIGSILKIIGYLQTAKDESGFMRAIYCTILSFIFYFTAYFTVSQTGFLGWVGTVLNIFAQVLQLAAFVFTITGLMNLSAECNRQDMVVKGAVIIKTISWIYILSFIVLVLTRVFRDNIFNRTLATILSSFALVLTVAQYILYLSYLAKAKKMLNKG